MNTKRFLCCPACGSKTRVMVNTDTVIHRLPLYCPKCKRETLVDVRNQKLTPSA